MADRVSIGWFALGLLLVVVFAWTRPLTLRDFENRRLAKNSSAQVFFTLLYVVFYMILVAAYFYGGKAVMGFTQHISWVSFTEQFGLAWLRHWLERPEDAKIVGGGAYAPLLALTTLGWMQSLQVLRELERTALVYTYSARYLYSDVRDLNRYFQTHDYEPTDEERAKNRQVLERLNIVLTDTDTSKIDMTVVRLWRKVETLLRHLAIWQGESKNALNRDERDMQTDVITAHERKTELASNIIRMLDHVASGKGAANTLSEVSELLTSGKYDDRRKLEAVEAKLETALASEPVPAAKGPIFLSSVQLKGFLTQIHLYFEAEYRILLARTSELAAKSIVYSGDRARARLQSVKEAGFKGLGRLVPISFNRILWVFFAVFAFSFLLFMFRQADMWKQSIFSPEGAGGWRANRQTQEGLMMIAVIALTMATSTIVGAVVGSTRRLAQAPQIPWRIYVGAGLVAVCLFLLAHNVKDMLWSGVERVGTTITAVEGTSPVPNAAAPVEHVKQTPAVRPMTFLQTLPWALMPFFMTIGICLLARIPRWPSPPGLEKRPNLRASIDRTIDAIALASIMILAQLVILRGAFPLLGISPPARLRIALANEWVPLSLLWLPLIMGLFIGALVIRDVRRAAHSRLILPSAEPELRRATAADMPLGARAATG